MWYLRILLIMSFTLNFWILEAWQNYKTKLNHQVYNFTNNLGMQLQVTCVAFHINSYIFYVPLVKITWNSNRIMNFVLHPRKYIKLGLPISSPGPTPRDNGSILDIWIYFCTFPHPVELRQLEILSLRSM